jgi:nitrile hydratase accessory protein
MSISETVRPKLAEQLASDLSGSSAPPRRNGELVFEHPWESRAFGIAVTLCERKAYDWEEFRSRLIEEIAAFERNNPDKQGFNYYRCWAAALERLLTEKGICSAEEIDRLVSTGRD